jgi:hypothetical protein
MKPRTLLLLSALLLAGAAPAGASGELQSSRSVGKLRQDQTIDLKRLLEQAEPVVREKPSRPENYLARASDQQQDDGDNRHDQLFEIYEADVQLLADLDGDGFYHTINLFFDVDVSVDSATVYAKLYLSREGGPWSQYYTTDLFIIHGDDFEDAYEVETELLQGYPPGYYALLVEVYSLDHAAMVASEVLDYHYLGRDLTIEDLERDEPYVEEYSSEYYEEYYFSSGGGSIAALLAFFLIIQVVIAARGSLALSPRNQSDEKKKKMTP